MHHLAVHISTEGGFFIASRVLIHGTSRRPAFAGEVDALVFAPAVDLGERAPRTLCGSRGLCLLGVWSPVATHQVDLGTGPRSTT